MNDNLSMMSASVDVLRTQFAKFSEQDKERDNLVNSLLRGVIERENKIRALSIDLEDQRDSRIKYQEDSRDLREQNRKFVHMINKDAYVAVLIDGDGAKFLDSLLQDPIQGAAEAALRLKQAVRDYLKDTPLGTEDVPIIVRIYANLNDLAKSLRLSNVINSDDCMRSFAEQFTNSCAEFDFVNVGRGKENADSKMRKMFNHFYKNIQCKKIFFAGCHDTGYVHELRERRGEPDAEERVVLLETTPAEPPFKSLNFALTRFNNVFRSECLGNERKRMSRVLSTQSDTPLMTMDHPIPSIGETTLNKVSDLSAAPKFQYPEPIVTSTSPVDPNSGLPAPPAASSDVLPVRHSPPLAKVTTSGNGGISVQYPSSYASVGGLNGHHNISLPVAKTKKAKIIEYNDNSHRLDPPNKHPGNTPAQEPYKQKCETIKPRVFCNDFYLVGRCERAEKCKMEHDVKLMPGELAIQRYKARTSLCPNGPTCSNYNCYLSHHCPFGPLCSRGSECKFSRTTFGDLHLSGDDLRAATRWTDGKDFPEHL